MRNKLFKTCFFSLIIVTIHSISFFIAYNLGLGKDDLLNNLTSTLPSVLTIIITISIVFFLKENGTVQWSINKTDVDWKTRVRVNIFNYSTKPIYEIKPKAHFAPFRQIKKPPTCIEGLDKDHFIIEFGSSSPPKTSSEEFKYIKNKNISFIVFYRDGTGEKPKKKKIHIKNSRYIPFVKTKPLMERLLKR